MEIGMSSRHSGSCLCGAASFEIEGDFGQFYLCHCTHCRKDTGSAHAANLFSSTARLNWLSGQDKARLYNLPATRHTRCFCSICGSALPYALEGMLVVPAGSLDTALDTTPDAHLFARSRASWDRQLEKIPAHESFPSSPRWTEPRSVLRRIKLLHTAIWAFFAACVLAIPVAVASARFGVALGLIAVVALEVLVLLFNRLKCPLTDVAARHTADRRDNFDIYLPLWLARYNKHLFGVLYVAGILYTLIAWRGVAAG
ncbi:MAG: hypothetical protein AMXMBFR37_05710 [Steroidobacteraceae bacterium]